MNNVSQYTSVDQLPIMMNAEQVGHLLGISRAGAYALFHRENFPCVRINKRMLVQRDALLQWLDKQSQEDAKMATTE